MPAYQYEAISKQGKSSKGIIEADSEKQAREVLRGRKLTPIGLSEIGGATKNARANRYSIKSSALALLTRQLATLLAAGIPVEESLAGVSEQTEDANARKILIGVRSKVLEGYGLAQALGEYPQVFPELYRATVGAGEQSGKLDLVLEKLADYTENQQGTRQKIQQALIYPCLMIVVSIGIISFLLAFVVPKIIEVFSSSGQTLPWMTEYLILISNFVQSYGIYILIVVIGLIAAFRYSLRNFSFRKGWHRLLLKMPITCYLVKTTNVARYIHTFGILFSAGVPVLEAMRVGASLITNIPIHEAFNKASAQVREGESIHLALKDTKYVNPMAIHLIASGEKSGQLPEMMEKAAAHMDHEVKRLIDTALILLEPMVILLMGAMVLFIVLATLLPIFSMEQLVA